MAFEKDTNTNTAVNPIPANKQARGFINLYLPRKNGTRAKLGAINLRKNYANESELADWIEKNPEQALALIKDRLILEYNSATPAEGSGFDLEPAPAKGKGK